MKKIDTKDLKNVSGGGNVGDVALRYQDEKGSSGTEPVKTIPGGSNDLDDDAGGGGLGDIELG